MSSPGCVLYQTATGRVPFEGETLSTSITRSFLILSQSAASLVDRVCWRKLKMA
jgi:hypothetical protein